MEEPGPDNTEGRAHARHREPEIQLLTIMGLITKIPGCPITHSQYLTIIHHVHPSYIIFTNIQTDGHLSVLMVAIVSFP